jgi:hypothetical protein
MAQSREDLFEAKAIDREFYAQRLQNFLPARIIDVHTHVWLDRFTSKQKEENLRAVTWPQRVALDNSIEDLMETYRLMFPDKMVIPLIFGMAISHWRLLIARTNSRDFRFG